MTFEREGAREGPMMSHSLSVSIYSLESKYNPICSLLLTILRNCQRTQKLRKVLKRHPKQPNRKMKRLNPLHRKLAAFVLYTILAKEDCKVWRWFFKEMESLMSSSTVSGVTQTYPTRMSTLPTFVLIHPFFDYRTFSVLLHGP
jgi:hypothetical protein